MPPRRPGKGGARSKPQAAAPGIKAASCTRNTLPEFQKWMTDNGISWDKSLIKFSGGTDDHPDREALNNGASEGGWGVWAAADVPEGSTLCVISKNAILSVRTTSIADLLVKERLGGGLGLTIAVMLEAAIGPRSKW